MLTKRNRLASPASHGIDSPRSTKLRTAFMNVIRKALVDDAMVFGNGPPLALAGRAESPIAT